VTSKAVCSTDSAFRINREPGCPSEYEKDRLVPLRSQDCSGVWVKKRRASGRAGIPLHTPFGPTLPAPCFSLFLVTRSLCGPSGFLGVLFSEWNCLAETGHPQYFGRLAMPVTPVISVISSVTCPPKFDARHCRL
jgi:hypothetical protein